MSALTEIENDAEVEVDLETEADAEAEAEVEIEVEPENEAEAEHEFDTEAREEIIPSFYTVVNGIGEDGERWKEVADVFSFTASGVGFYTARECTVGNLVSLMLQMPPHLRCYDHEEEFYQIWGLVQHCHLSSSNELTAFQVGVAFVGKFPPASYGGNPLQNYRICGMDKDGLWKVTESTTRFVQRKHLRYWKKIDLYLALIDSRRETIGGERAITENISKSGAAVLTSLDLNIGDRVKFISEKFDFSGLAIVCNMQTVKNGKTRLNLEFVENTFPVEKFKRPKSRK